MLYAVQGSSPPLANASRRFRRRLFRRLFKGLAPDARAGTWGQGDRCVALFSLSPFSLLKRRISGGRLEAFAKGGEEPARAVVRSSAVSKVAPRVERHLIFYNVRDFAVASRSARMTVPRNACSSSDCTPTMVDPDGEVTWSFSSPGCLPVSSTILADPMTACAAI